MDVVEKTADLRLAAVEAARAAGRSVAAACRDAGISTSTYYRLRKPLAAPAEPPPEPALAVLETPRAPRYWESAFADELTDSYIRRELVGGTPLFLARPETGARPLADGLARQVRRFRRQLAASPLGFVAPGALAAMAFVAIAAAGSLMVTIAADAGSRERAPSAQSLAAADLPVGR